MLVEIPKTPIEELKTPFLEFQKIRIFIKRDDLNDPLLMGNKFRKLKYNLIAARAKNCLNTSGSLLIQNKALFASISF